MPETQPPALASTATATTTNKPNMHSQPVSTQVCTFLSQSTHGWPTADELVRRHRTCNEGTLVNEQACSTPTAAGAQMMQTAVVRGRCGLSRNTGSAPAMARVVPSVGAACRPEETPMPTAPRSNVGATALRASGSHLRSASIGRTACAEDGPCQRT